MAMTGICHICGKPATQSCSICGSITCDKHTKMGICIECIGGSSEGEISSKDVYS